MKSILITMLVGLGALASGCAHSLLTKGQEPWLAGQVPALVNYTLAPDTAPLVVEQAGRGCVRYRKADGGNSDKGLVRFHGDEWVYFVSWSSDFSPDLPDLVVAIDDRGHLYACNGHVCPDLYLTGLDTLEPRTVDEFIRGRVLVGTGRPGTERWVQVDEWKTRFANKPSEATSQ